MNSTNESESAEQSIKQLCEMFPSADPENIRQIYSESNNLDQAVSQILELESSKTKGPSSRAREVPQRRAHTPAFPTGVSGPKIFQPLYGYHLYLPSRIVSVDCNPDIFGTFAGPIDEENDDMESLEHTDITKSYDPSHLSPFGALPKNLIHSTPIDRNTNAPCWNLSAISSDHSWRCLFSSDDHDSFVKKNV